MYTNVWTLNMKLANVHRFGAFISKRWTFSPDDPKTSRELNCSVKMRMAKGEFSIRSRFGEFLLLGK